MPNYREVLNQNFHPIRQIILSKIDSLSDTASTHVKKYSLSDRKVYNPICLKNCVLVGAFFARPKVILVLYWLVLQVLQGLVTVRLSHHGTC